MSALQEVRVEPLRPERFAEILSDDMYGRFGAAIERGRSLFEGRTVWNVNSTGKGGGVAEMLASLIAYAQGAGVDTRWIVISGTPDFFTITKRIHNNLHGAPGDGGELGDREREIYERTLKPNADEFLKRVHTGDIVLLHDPQTAGLIEPLKSTGASVLWRCHVGLDDPNECARAAWRFLGHHVAHADRYIFSRRAFAWEDLEDERIVVIAPSIDAFSPKNQDMDPATVTAILATAGLIDGSVATSPSYVKVSGAPGLVTRRAEMVGAPAPRPDVPMVVQVSRWDRLKDPIGVMQGFVDHIAPSSDAHLFLAGPSVADVADDPEGAEVLEEVRAAWSTLNASVKDRIHLACLPMDDLEENAAMVNALQRRADVVVQKSLAEGFGLTVAEGMWKGRAVVASRIGGIQDQIVHGESGALIDDAHDLDTFGKTVRNLLADDEARLAMGRAARERVREGFLGPRHLMEYVDLFASVIDGS